MNIKYAADLLVDMLQKSGIERVYGITGDSANHITDAISRSDVRFIHTRHEEVAALAAGAEAAATGRLAVCMGSCGPGSLHLVNGLYDAHRNGSSVLAIVTEINESQIGTGFIQEIDTRNIFSGCSHYCQYVQSVEQMGRIVGIAMQTAISRHGVSVVIISGSISSTQIEQSLRAEYLPHYAKPRVTPSEDELRSIANILNNSQRIAVFGGAGCIGASSQVMTLASTIKAAVAWTSRGVEALDWDNPYPVGMAGILGTSAAEYALEHCDALLLLGCGFAFNSMYPNSTRIVQIDIAGENLARRHNIELGIIGDIASTLELLNPMLLTKSDDSFAKECTQKYVKAKYHLRKLTEQAQDSKHKIYPEHLVSMLNDKIDPHAWITADMGTSWAFAARYLDSKGGRRFYMSALHGTMAGALPSAIGLSLAEPNRQIVALCGDGGLSMLLGDLLTLNQEQLSPKIILFNNSSLDFVSMEMKADGLRDSYTNLLNPNFAEVARAMGIKSIRVEYVNELEQAIDEALSSSGAVIVDVVVDPNALLLPPHITVHMADKYSSYAAKMVFDGNAEELLEEAITNARVMVSAR